jgi:hypothetical protein
MMVSTQVVIEFVRNTPLEPETLDRLADACLTALQGEACFLALGPVVSVDYERSAVEVECTICTETADDVEIDAKVKRVGEIMRDALVAAEYETTVERIAVPA